MTILERFERQDNEDIVIIGEIIDKALRSDFGELLRIMIANLNNLEIANSRNGNGSSDKVLGRLEGYQTFLSDLETFVARKNELQRPIAYSDEESSQANEQISPLRGGEI